jgi:hypothetical protein
MPYYKTEEEIVAEMPLAQMSKEAVMLQYSIFAAHRKNDVETPRQLAANKLAVEMLERSGWWQNWTAFCDWAHQQPAQERKTMLQQFMQTASSSRALDIKSENASLWQNFLQSHSGKICPEKSPA